jgi:hypothetical protein
MADKSAPVHNNTTLKSEEECEYCSLLNIATQNGENVTVFTEETWCSGPRAARPGRLYRRILLLHIYVKFMFTGLKHSHPFQIEVLQMFLSRT